MVTCYFGVPGVGKSTIGTKLAQKELKRIKKGRSPYKYVLTNFSCSGCYKIDFSDIGTYDIQHCLIILDEITCDADNRDFKNFKKSSVEGWMYHRHYYNDIIYLTQNYQAVDKKIRDITQRLYYMTKSYILPISKFRQVFRTYTINEYTQELVCGYRFANLWECLLSLLPFSFSFGTLKGFVFRPFYYKYFDSFCQPLDLKPFQFTSWDSIGKPEV